MLKVGPKGQLKGLRDLSPNEDQTLRRAFGRYAEPKARNDGAEIVRRYQHAGPGQWFYCDCLGPGVTPPALVLAEESYIRRHYDPPWPEHADGCDFQSDPSELAAITRSHARPPAGPLLLLRRIREDKDEDGPARVAFRSRSQRRDALATVLMQLIDNAGLNSLPAVAAIPDLREQYARLRTAAEGIKLDQALPVATYLCTYPPALPEFFQKIAKAPSSRFRKTRPHGLLVAVASKVGGGQIVFGRDQAVAVRGEIAVFAEPDGHGREMPSEKAARAPYLVIALVGRPTSEEPPMLLRAYAHPCVSHQHLMLVDSNLERHTLRELRSLQAWLANSQGIAMEIIKPLFDIARGQMDDGPRPPCIPDFILDAPGVSAGGRQAVLVETMGFADPVYRQRKERSHALMKRLTGEPIVLHDFHEPPDAEQRQRDRRFWLDARWTLTGPAQPSHPANNS